MKNQLPELNDDWKGDRLLELNNEETDYYQSNGDRFHNVKQRLKDRSKVTHFLGVFAFGGFCFLLGASGFTIGTRNGIITYWRAKLGEQEWFFFCVRDRNFESTRLGQERIELQLQGTGKLQGNITVFISISSIDKRHSHFGNRRFAYDGKKCAFTARKLPFKYQVFIISVPEKDGRIRDFRVAVKFAAKKDLHHL